MLRKIIVILVWLSAFYLPMAKGEDGSVAQTGRETQQIQPASRQGALFRISHKNHTLFLFGTIHVGQADFYPLEPIVTQALAQSSKLALELDPSNTRAVQQAVQQFGFYPDGAGLQLAPGLQTRLTAVLKGYGLSWESVSKMKPWMVVLVLTVQEFAAKGFQASLGIDAHLLNAAQAQKKPVVELETAHGQIALFGNMSIGDQIRYLEEAVMEIEDTRAEQKIRQITRLWHEADANGLDALQKEMARDASFTGKFFQRAMLDGRNPSLAKGIEKLLISETQSFAGIGILHLIGERGVPALLRQRGYLVERVY